MKKQIIIIETFLILQLSMGANVDTPFSQDPEDLQLKEISDNLRRVSGAVMGLAEYVLEIRSDVRTIRADITDLQSSNTTREKPYDGHGHHHIYYSRPIRDPEELRRQSLELADKVEKLLAMEQSPEVDLAKEELKKTVEKNFLRMLAAILVTGPAHTQDRSEDIFKLMKATLNGELDFTPVVEKLPLILRDSETNQFVNLLITLREVQMKKMSKSERVSAGFPKSYRQGLIQTVDATGQNIIPNPVYNNYQHHNQYYNPVQTRPQYIPGSAQYRPTNNNLINSNNLVPANGINTNNNNLYNPNINANNFQQVGASQGTVVSPTQSPSATTAPNSNQLPSINSIIDGINQTNQLLKELPTLVEGLQTLVESLEGIIG